MTFVAAQTTMPSVDPFWTCVWLLGILLVVWFLYRAHRRLDAQQEAEERVREQEQRDKIQRLRDAGALLEDGQLKCIVCGRAPATQRWPAVKRTKLDQDWLGHRKLHHHLPMYEVVDSDDVMPQVCMPHRRLIERKLEQVLGGYRSQAAQLNAEVEQDLSRWEAGGLLLWAQDEARELSPMSSPRRMNNMLQLGPGSMPPPSAPTISAVEATPLHHQGGTVTLAPADEDDGGAT